MSEYFAVRSVLGDTRMAEVRPGDGQPWFNCPFCTTAIYAEAGPGKLGVFVGRHGICNNPWCVANPAMPLDAARLARGEAILAEMAEAERRRNHEAAMTRIAEYGRSRQAAWDEIRTEATERGACVGCAFASFARGTGRRLVRHRGPCPRAIAEQRAE